MRLICPNCGAQYEVPTEVIPESGRDVQCSDCGTTWFQHHPDHPPEIDDDAPPVAASDETSHEDENADTSDHAADYGVDDDDEDDALDAPVAATAAQPKRREIDPTVADVLREEAVRETRARENDNRGTVETQQELGLEKADNDAKRRSEEARARMARLRGEREAQAHDDTFEDIDPSSRSNLLPDIDEINSSLDSDGTKEDRRPAAPVDPVPDAEAAPRRSGFGAGFRLAVILALVAVLIYAFAPQLSNAVPQLADPLSGYVDTVNGWRMGLNDMMQGLANSLSEEGAADG